MKKNNMNRKHSIILTSIKILNELGIQGLSSSEIAKREGISEGTLYSHFKGKKDIINSILDHYLDIDKAIRHHIQLNVPKGIDAIVYLVSAYGEYYENNPDITCLLGSYDMFLDDPELNQRCREITELRTAYMIYLIEKAQSEGALLNKDDGQALCDIIPGAFRIIILKWRQSNYSFPLKERMLSTLNSTLSAFTKTSINIAD